MTLQEQGELVKSLKVEGEETRRNAMSFVNAINAAAAIHIIIFLRECAKLKRMLEEEKKLVERLLEKDDEAQMFKRKYEEIGQQLADARKDVGYATTRADVAERECDELKRMLEEKQEVAHVLARVTKRQVEEISKQLINAQKDVEFATARADTAENEWSKAKKQLQEERELVRRLELRCDEIRQSAMRQVEEKKLELANSRNACAIAERECAELKRMLEEKEEVVHAMARVAKRQVEEIGKQLIGAQKDVAFATTRAGIAENERGQMKRELQEKLELVQLLKLECRETRQNAMRKMEEKELELANALNDAVAAAAECRAAAAEACAICLTNEKDMAFGCGHMTCGDCGVKMSMCPICRKPIINRLKLFPG
ncbi:trichohyalin-like isoform X1 [Senna tora]|uniref:Trichohyalin-like isoform X1 n=1 Tax=Senna tora TaxID=362788 RepID=A0A834X005_9FABA|nr:trichohyalin-like isoform X1 [Senna tora]